jgi:hypothetical protein
MAITKETEIGKMEVDTEYKHIQVRTDTVIKEDGKELSRTYHRHVIKPDISDENLAKEHAEVQAIANAVMARPDYKDRATRDAEAQG